DKRRVAASSHDRVGLLAVDRYEGERATQPSAHRPHGLLERKPGSDLLAEQLRNDLGVSLGLAADACVLKLIPQCQVILDNPVVYEGDPPISRSMRVGVDVVRAAMSRPSGVSDAKSAARQRFLGQYLLEVAELAGFLRDVQLFASHNCNACRVVAAIFQTPQTLDHDV